MSSIVKRIFFIRAEKFFLVLSFLLSSLILFPIAVFACSMAFQEVTPEQLKAHLALIAPNKKDIIDNLDIDSSVSHILTFFSNTGIRFQITKDSSLAQPEIEFSSSAKVLKVPSYDWLHNSSSDSLLKRWLIGHEVYPYTSPTKTIQYTEVQNTAFMAFKQAFMEGAKSFLHISPTSTGKMLTITRVLKEKLQNHRRNKISLVTVDQTQLVDQLFEAIQYDLRDKDVTVINWNNRLNKDFYVEIGRSVRRDQPTVFVITTQSLKSQLDLLQRENEKDYTRLVENTDGIYIDEAHHLGAVRTKSALLQLQERSGAFLYGTTATPVHHEMNLREFFEREHWSYLNTIEKGNLFASHPAEKVIEQLAIGIARGEITYFDRLYIIGEGEKGFDVTKEKPLFTQPDNRLRVLNPHYYNKLAGMLYTIFQFNKKGFIVTATIAEAKRLSEFLSEAVEGITFETYHSKMTREQRQEVLENSREMSSHYIVAVRALDEGVNLPHLSAYIDLNVNVSVKQMVHRIGRVLRLHPGKTGADILFLADYKNAKMAKDLLNLLDIIKVSNFGEGKIYRSSSEDMELRNPDIIPLTREELQKITEKLRESIISRSFWSDEKIEKPTFEELVKLFVKKDIRSGVELRILQYQNDPELKGVPSFKLLNKEYPEWKESGGWKYVRSLNPNLSYEAIVDVYIRYFITSDKELRNAKIGGGRGESEIRRIPVTMVKQYPQWKENGGWRYIRARKRSIWR